MYCVKCQMEEVAQERVNCLTHNGLIPMSVAIRERLITCLRCGEADARRVRHTVVPMHKSNYVVVSDRELLKCLNKVARG
jgi:hypothetical protein